MEGELLDRPRELDRVRSTRTGEGLYGICTCNRVGSLPNLRISQPNLVVIPKPALIDRYVRKVCSSRDPRRTDCILWLFARTPQHRKCS